MNPRQWSLAKQSRIKVANGGPEVPNQAEARRDGVINPQIYNFNKFQYEKFWCSINATNQPKSTVEHSPSSWNIKRDFYPDVYTIFTPERVD